MNNIITFADAASRLKPIVKATSEQEPEPSYRDERKARRAERLAEVATNPNLTTSCRNQRLRLSRRDAWWAARDLTNYWRARLNWDSALEHAQSHDIADANSLPKFDDGPRGRFALVDLWRAALVSQMLTPAPDAAAVAWKKAAAARGDHKFTDVEPEQIEPAIVADVEWLAAHPSKKSIAASRQAESRKQQPDD